MDIFLYPDVLYRADLSGQLLLFGFSRRHTQLSGIADDMHTDAVSLYSDILYLSNGRRCDGKRADCREYEEQILLQKKQYEFYLQKREAERIFRHDARHRDSILISYLENGEVEGAKEFLKKELAEIEKNAKIPFCENTLINAVLSEYRTKAEQEGLEFSARIQMPKELACDEAEFCVMLSNLLENSLDAAKSYIAISIKHLNHQLSLNVKNDYEGELKKSAENNYLTTKPQGSGLGLKSVEAILKSNSGFLKIEDTDGVFDVFATLKN